MEQSSAISGNKPNLTETLRNLQRVLSSPELSESLLNKTLLIEFKHLQKFCPSGVYIVPQYDNIKIWHGVLFVREGYYKDGIFKFEIHIPNEYPNQPPKVIFVSKVFHPLIDSASGLLDLTKKFPVWEIGKSFLVKVIYYVQDIFYNPIYLRKGNEEGDSLPNEMVDEIIKCVKKSVEDRFVNKENSSIKFSEFTKYHQLILDKILKQNKEISTYDRIEDFKNWFMNNFMEIIPNAERAGKAKK